MTDWRGKTPRRTKQPVLPLGFVRYDHLTGQNGTRLIVPRAQCSSALLLGAVADDGIEGQNVEGQNVAGQNGQGGLWQR